MSRRRRRRRCRQPPIVHWRSQKLSSPNYATSLYNSNITSKTVSFFPFLKNLNLKTIIFKNAKLYLFFTWKLLRLIKQQKKRTIVWIKRADICADESPKPSESYFVCWRDAIKQKSWQNRQEIFCSISSCFLLILLTSTRCQWVTQWRQGD